MSALASGAAEVATGARKKNKKVKASSKDDIAERARQTLEALQLLPPLTNGTSEHGFDAASVAPTVAAPREFGGPQLSEAPSEQCTPTLDAPKEFGDTEIPNACRGYPTLDAPWEFRGSQTPNTPSEVGSTNIMDAPVDRSAAQTLVKCQGAAGASDSVNIVQLPSIVKLSAHSEHCNEGCCGQKLQLLENLEEALVSLESALEEQRAAAQQDPVEFVSYESELQMGEIMRLIQNDLSEPYSIYTYRYFIHNWPNLCFLAMVDGHCIGAVVCKLDLHRNVKRGYIAMLAVDEKYRKRKIGSRLVRQAIQAMIQDNADEVVLETEITNKPALRLYENLGFVRDKRLFRYYLNGVDALRLKLWLR